MKRILLISLILIILLLLGCGNSPKSVAQKFFAAMGQRDFTAAAKFVAKDSQDYLMLMQEDFRRMSAAEKEANTWKYTIRDISIDGTNAIVSYEKAPALWDNGSGSDAKSSTGKITLITEDKKWKVALEPDSPL